LTGGNAAEVGLRLVIDDITVSLWIELGPESGERQQLAAHCRKSGRALPPAWPENRLGPAGQPPLDSV
jgi:hypothetical protein